MFENENSEDESVEGNEVLRIEPFSNYLFMESFSTMPIEPRYLEVIFNCRGIEIPSQQERNYIRKCREEGIIPFSTLKLDFDKSGLVTPKLEVKSEEPFKDMAMGGRYNVVTVTANGKKVIDSVLKNMPDFLDRGYIVTRGELVDYGIELIGRASGIELSGNPERIEELKDWFSRLKIKYHDNKPKPSKGSPVLEGMFDERGE